MRQWRSKTVSTANKGTSVAKAAVSSPRRLRAERGFGEGAAIMMIILITHWSIKT